MSKPGDAGWTLLETVTDESGNKRVRYHPVPGDPRPLIGSVERLLGDEVSEEYRLACVLKAYWDYKGGGKS